jgi:hypothetical protein
MLQANGIEEGDEPGTQTRSYKTEVFFIVCYFLILGGLFIALWFMMATFEANQHKSISCNSSHPASSLHLLTQLKTFPSSAQFLARRRNTSLW